MVILYQSGVMETLNPNDLVFTDQEILNLLDDYKIIRTQRLSEIPNTWCVWGENKKIDESEFNKLGSDILQEDVFSPLLFIHDTQIDPAWMLTDPVILISHEDFVKELMVFFDFIAENVLKESQKIREAKGQNTNQLVFLNTIGPTEDKRVLFEFDPNNQSQEFYDDNIFINFADKVREFLIKAKNKKVFYIYEDKKTVIFVKDENVEFLFDKIITIFKRKENYEYCQQLITLQDNWKKSKQPKKKSKKE